MKLQDLSLEQLKEIDGNAPEGATFYDSKNRKYVKTNYDGAYFFTEHGNWSRISITASDFLIVNVPRLSDIRAQIEKIEAQSNTNVTLSAGSIENKGFDGSEKPVFKVGDKVVFTDIACFPSDLLSVTQMTEFEIYLSNGMSVGHDLEWLRHATAEEEAAGQRIDEPSSSCGMTGAEIDQFGEDLRSKPYVDFSEFEQADCEACRASLGTIRDYMIVCPDCGNKRCPQALNHRYKCTGSNAVNQAGELKEPDTITTQLDPAKCRIVDPALAYDGPGDCPKDEFDAMSEKHRSPSCKCHEFPIDAELKAPAGMKHDQSKPRYSLIPAGALALVVDVLEYGATKYAPDGWKHVKNARERYYNASMRHVQAWWSGERLDPETGLPHLAHAVCSLMFLMALDREQGE